MQRRVRCVHIFFFVLGIVLSVSPSAQAQFSRQGGGFGSSDYGGKVSVHYGPPPTRTSNHNQSGQQNHGRVSYQQQQQVTYHNPQTLQTASGWTHSSSFNPTTQFVPAMTSKEGVTRANAKFVIVGDVHGQRGGENRSLVLHDIQNGHASGNVAVLVEGEKQYQELSLQAPIQGARVFGAENLTLHTAVLEAQEKRATAAQALVDLEKNTLKPWQESLASWYNTDKSKYAEYLKQYNDSILPQVNEAIKNFNTAWAEYREVQAKRDAAMWDTAKAFLDAGWQKVYLITGAAHVVGVSGKDMDIFLSAKAAGFDTVGLMPNRPDALTSLSTKSQLTPNNVDVLFNLHYNYGIGNDPFRCHE